VGVGRDDGKTKGEYSPILYRTASLQLIESNTFWLSPTPDQISVGWDAALPRICTYARFEHRKSKKQFWVFNTHFDHIGEEARKQAASLIIETIEKVNQDQLPVVVTGDFNLTPDTVPIQLLQAKYEDVMGNSVSTDLHYGTFNGFDLTQKGDRRIDYIFQKGFSLKRAKHLWIKTDEGRWASDHHPVYARLKF
jgi:endonuclease/exonuclease/phosphatase family metal-dependent hydrolase